MEKEIIPVAREDYIQALLYLQQLAEKKYKRHLALTKKKNEIPREKYEVLYLRSANDLLFLNALIQKGFDGMKPEN